MILEIERPRLTTYQEEILYNGCRYTVTEASTKAGKTFCHIWWIFERAHEPWNKPGYNHWWVAPVYSQAKIAFKRLKTKVVKSGLYKINETNLIITTPDGVEIHFKSAEKPDNLFGEDVYSIVFDEAPRAREEAHFALRTTITATKGVYKLIGNFGGVSNWVHQLKSKAKTDPEYYYKKITAWDAVEEGIIDREEVEQAEKDLPSKVFKQLYLAEQQESNDMLINYFQIDNLFTNDFVKPGVMAMTCDIAMLGSDKFVIGVWSGRILKDILIFDKTDGKQVEEIIKQTAQKHQVGRSNIVYDADGLGGYLKGYLKGARPFHNGGKVIKQAGVTPNYKNLKSQCGYELAKNIDTFFFDIPKTSAIIEELEMLRSYQLDKDGKIQLLPKAKVIEEIGHSPDILDMITMFWLLILKQSFTRATATSR